MSTTIILPRTIIEHAKREAEKLGISLVEYLLELISSGMDPKDKALEYIKVAKELLEQVREEIGKGDLRQAAEKVWGAAALSIKAYAYWKECKRLASHGELWRYKEKVSKELGEWVREAWIMASSMHVCFYEGLCTRGDVEITYKHVERLVKEVEERIRG
ncbi:MAG: hypothetical protein B6U76_02290 [Desulfurococcales archaeon ex4484_217_2]|nr:MAG: hypothetical protein B6U76_02290 [Desulfurococcales archaeon ex4484_217_2]